MWLHAQGAAQGLAPQIVRPHCDEHALLEQEARWLKPAGCRRVDWQIRFDVAQFGREDPARHRSLYFPDRSWWLLSAATSLLRPPDDGQAHLAVNASVLGGGEPVEGAWPLPDSGAAPAFFAIGNAAGTTVGVQRVRVTHVADSPATVWRMGLIALQRRAIAWLAEVMRVKSQERLLVVWLGMDRTVGKISDASGDRSFISCYRPGDARGSTVSLMMLAHEQFHQLAALDYQASHPAWYGESLAQFYALRAMMRLGSHPREVQALHRRFIDAARPLEAGLLDWQRRYEAGDAAAYPQFHTQGATFWHQLDALLRLASSGRYGLDQDLPALLGTATAEASPLPMALRRQWREMAGPAVDALIQRYLGSA